MLGEMPMVKAGAPERRLNARRPFAAKVLVLWKDGPLEPTPHRVDDYSLGGFRIRSDRPLAKGERGFAIKILPEGSRLESWVEVVWCRALERVAAGEKGSPMHAAGVRFIP